MGCLVWRLLANFAHVNPFTRNNYYYLTGLTHKKLASNSHRYLYWATSPGGRCWGCYPGALSSMSDRCDSPGDRVPIDEICEHFVVGWVEMTWISKGRGVSVAVLVMVAGPCTRIIFNYKWLYKCILITVMLDNKPFWNWIELKLI